MTIGRRAVILASILGALIALFAVPVVIHDTSAPPVGEAMPALVSEPQPERITLLFAGDVMLSRAIGKIMEREGFDFPYRKIGTLISDADIAFANLETSVSSRGKNVGSIYSFRTDPDALPALQSAGFDVVSVANNHIWDWGREAFVDTLAHVRANGILPVGGGINYAEAHAPVIIEQKGVKVAFLAYTNLLPEFLLKASSSPAVAFPTKAALATDIKRAKDAGADIVVASFHWGEEYKTAHNAYQDEMAKAAVDAGALIVAGHHPHTPQEIEEYNSGLIIYSLGNFVFDQNFDEYTRRGLVVRVTVEEGRITNHESIEIRFTKGYQPYVVSE